MNSELKTDLRRAWSGQMPVRNRPGREYFFDLAASSLIPGCRILDVGSGRKPVLEIDARPPGCEYVGVDISRAELETAPEGSYDSIVVGDVCHPIPGLQSGFDLAISWQLLEHVASLDMAIENIRSYLRPGGQFLAQFSGSFSYFALASHVVPHRLKVKMIGATGRDYAVFPAPYDHCWDSQIRRIMRPWSESEVIPRFFGGGYVKRVPPLLLLNDLYEHWALSRHHRNLATHYVVNARR